MKTRISILAILIASIAALATSPSYAISSSAFEFQDDPAYEQFKQAKEMMYDDKYHAAIDAFREIVKKYPKSKYLDQCHFWIAYSMEKQGKDLEKAFDAYEHVVETYPNSPWANDAKTNMVKLAKRLYSQGKTKYKAYLEQSTAKKRCLF